MSAFLDAYRVMLAREMRCPKCGAQNIEGASETIEVDQTGTLAFCNTCSCKRPVEAFLPKGFL